MGRFSALSKSFASKAIAMVVIGALSSTAGATQLDAANEVDGTNEAVESPEKPVEAKKITDRRHPDYLRCRTEAIVGSLAKKRKVCMTNKQWTEARKRGNRLANNMISTIQAMSGGGSFTDGK